MQRSLILLLFLFLLPGIADSQITGPRWYLKIGSGFGFKGFLPQEFNLKTILPSNSSLDPADGQLSDMANSVDSLGQKSLVHDTYSKGLNAFIGGGYRLSKYWGIELGVLWLQGGNIKSKSVYDNNPLLGKGASTEITTYARGLALTPSVTVNIPMGEKWYIQGRAGFTVPVYGDITHHLNIDAPKAILGKSSAVVEAKTQAGFSLGINGGIGIHRKFGKHFELSLDVLAQHLNLNGKHLTVKRYELTTNGKTVNMFETYKGSYHSEINFVKELTQSSNNKYSTKTVDETRPRDEPMATSPFSSVGLGIGLSYYIGKQKTE